MIGVYDFCGHYEWTFAWLEATGGPALLRAYWDEAIHQDSQRHARSLILSQGIEGMREYWGFTLDHEAAGYSLRATDTAFRIDMHQCPSKGFLLQNQLQQFHDYCDHCMGWIGPLMKDAGFAIDHEHNHCGQCWWEIRSVDDPTTPGDAGGSLGGDRDVRLGPDWKPTGPLDRYRHANDVDDKEVS